MSLRTAILLGFGLLTALLLQFRPIDDVDVFWQIRTGQSMLDTKQIVLRDSFTFTHHGERVPPIAWVAQIAYAALYRLGGWRALQIMHGLVFAAAFIVMALTTGRAKIGLFSIVAALAIGLEVALPHSSLRPQ